MLRQMTEQEKSEALDRAIAARDRGVAPTRRKTRRERAKVLRVWITDGTVPRDAE